MHTFEIPGWHPARVNELYDRHFWNKAKLKKRDRETVALAKHACRIPEAVGKRRVHVTIVLGPRMRGGDVDAYWKSLLDALVHCGLLIDDRAAYVELTPVKFDRGQEKSTVVGLEDIPADPKPKRGKK